MSLVSTNQLHGAHAGLSPRRTAWVRPWVRPVFEQLCSAGQGHHGRLHVGRRLIAHQVEHRAGHVRKAGLQVGWGGGGVGVWGACEEHEPLEVMGLWRRRLACRQREGTDALLCSARPPPK